MVKPYAMLALGAMLLGSGAQAREPVNILKLLPQTSPTTDYTEILRNSFGKGQQVRMPNTGKPYRVSGEIQVSGADAALICDRGTIIQSVATSGRFVNSSAPRTTIRGCLFDGQGRGAGAGRSSSEGFQWIGGGAKNAGSFVFYGASKGLIQNGTWENSSNSAIIIGAESSQISILDNHFQNNAAFGVSINGGSHDVLARGNWTTSNGLELLGATYSTHHITWTGNRASGTGDNCFSMSGSNSVVQNNEAIGCAFSGIGVFGSNNLITRNTTKNNGQCLVPTYKYYKPRCGATASGINVMGGYGGAGQNNTVINNVTDDNQARMTQNYGVRARWGYQAWKPAARYKPKSYIYSNGAIYLSTDGGESGTVQPKHSQGDGSDGGVMWTFLAKVPNRTAASSGNVINGNKNMRARLAPQLTNPE
ncbi:right-handed parallel beta-helix repeat-containing protein [Sphingobium sp. YR768]|uniref:right-handed parallel beta-helix repeat-containing protein n=1 Tax=Sphingobium sp. YR768 TaxID=1884365 RepID=UPI0008C6AB69|nr:right-handed parallel beta-helix repeat-containing protein [Sphingobium sp. YR768]SEQ53497.1 Right handed beta helix region [Sphingobium sp. YR768]